jgi:hypothetical protein
MDFMKWFIRYTGTFSSHDQIFPSHLDALWDNTKAAAHRKEDKTEKGTTYCF